MRRELLLKVTLCKMISKIKKDNILLSGFGISEVFSK